MRKLDRVLWSPEYTGTGALLPSAGPRERVADMASLACRKLVISALCRPTIPLSSRKSEKFTRSSLTVLNPRVSSTIFALRRSSFFHMRGTLSAIPIIWPSSRPSLGISSEVGENILKNRQKLLEKNLMPLAALLHRGY